MTLPMFNIAVLTKTSAYDNSVGNLRAAFQGIGAKAHALEFSPHADPDRPFLHTALVTPEGS
jgi:hypothetical protein